MLVWRSGRVEECNPEGFRVEPRWWHVWFSLVGKLTENCRKVVGKLSENSAECQCPWNIPSSSSELVGLTWSACRKSVTSPWYLSTASSGQAGGVFRQLFLQSMNAPRVCKLRKNCLTVIDQCATVLKTQFVNFSVNIFQLRNEFSPLLSKLVA